MARQRRYPPEIRRPQIIDAAKHILARYGYAGLTMRALAKQLHITQGALYGHFPSKKHIILALVDQTGEDARRYVGGAKHENALGRLEWLMRVQLRGSQRLGELSLAVFLETIRHGDADVRRHMMEAAEPWIRTIETIVAEAMAEHQGDAKLPPRRAAALTVSMFLGAVLFWSRLDPEASPDEQFELLWRALLHVIQETPTLSPPARGDGGSADTNGLPLLAPARAE